MSEKNILCQPPFTGLRLPVVAAPLFLVSTPALVIAQCTAGIMGSMPALNARPSSLFDEWLHEIQEGLAAWDRLHPDRPAAPFAINHIIHRSNERLETDLQICANRRVPVIISSLGAREDVNAAVHGWGGMVLHDVIDNRFARKAVEKGADGLIAVAAGAGGHAGRWSPFALVQEIRAWFAGPLALSGCIATGRSILAAQAMGADVAYIGSPFIATDEANASDAYKTMITTSGAADIIYSDFFTGVLGNYLRPSIVAAGLDPDNLVAAPDAPKSFGTGNDSKAWRDIWGAGQGIGVIEEIVPAAALVARLGEEYHAAVQELQARTA